VRACMPDSRESTSESRNRVLTTSINTSIYYIECTVQDTRRRKIQLSQNYEIRCINRNFISTFDESLREITVNHSACLYYILIYFDVTHFDDEIYCKFRSVVDP